MARLLVLYGPPSDAEAFESYRRETHVPLVRKIPGLQKIEISAGPVTLLQGEAPHHFVALLSFASMKGLQAALSSPEGQAAAADLANFASGGVTLVAFEEGEAWNCEG